MNPTSRKFRTALGFCAAGLSAFALAQPIQIKTVEVKTPVAFPAGAIEPRTSAVKRVRATLARNDRLGELQDGWLCSPKGNVIFNEKLWETVNRPIARVYRDELERAGYPVVKRDDSAFADQSRPLVSDLDVGVTVRRINANLCLKNRESMVGETYIELRFELYSPKAKKVVFDTTAEGSFQFPENYRPPPDGVFGEVIRIAVRNLLADPRLALWLSGANPLPAADLLADALKIRGERTGVLPTADNVTTLRAAVATVLTANGTGSGFFVSGDGYLITNYHVVRDSKFVKIKLATGRELAGEVLKVDQERDVALVKTEPVVFPALPIRAGEANVGEEVYVLGSPLGESFSGSLTRGVLSGHRLLGERRYIQSDASVLPGSSGGPLLDNRGAVIGMTVSGVRSAVGNMSLFIPIAEALQKLGVEIQQ